MIYEAECTRCHETYTVAPSRPITTRTDTPWPGFTSDDLQHGLRENGMETCGGAGKLTGAWG